METHSTEQKREGYIVTLFLLTFRSSKFFPSCSICCKESAIQLFSLPAIKTDIVIARTNDKPQFRSLLWVTSGSPEDLPTFYNTTGPSKNLELDYPLPLVPSFTKRSLRIKPRRSCHCSSYTALLEIIFFFDIGPQLPHGLCEARRSGIQLKIIRKNYIHSSFISDFLLCLSYNVFLMPLIMTIAKLQINQCRKVVRIMQLGCVIWKH